MKCECVGRGVKTRSCCGVCDAVERGGGGGATENVTPLSGGPLLTLESELVSAESGFPCRPSLVGVWEAVPVGELIGEAARREEITGGNGLALQALDVHLDRVSDAVTNSRTTLSQLTDANARLASAASS